MMFFRMLLDKALAIARRLENEIGIYELKLAFTHEFEAMRQDPALKDFLEAIGLTEYWTSTGFTWKRDTLHCQ